MRLIDRRTGIPGGFIQSVVSLVSRLAPQKCLTNRQSQLNAPDCLADGAYLSHLVFEWERGELSPPETLAFFQEVVDSGLAWKSTGAVRRTAALLIREGGIRVATRPPDKPRNVASQYSGKEGAGGVPQVSRSRLDRETFGIDFFETQVSAEQRPFARLD
jgi:hypothetical protein